MNPYNICVGCDESKNCTREVHAYHHKGVIIRCCRQKWGTILRGLLCK